MAGIFINLVFSIMIMCTGRSSTHVADVLQSAHFLLSSGGARGRLDDLAVLALLLGAMIHDAGHDGFTNSFHKNRVTQRALIYNDQSIQARYPTAAAICTSSVSIRAMSWIVAPDFSIWNGMNSSTLSEQENYHVWLIFDKMATHPELNILGCLPAAQFSELRRRLVTLVFATDMSRHFTVLQEARQVPESTECAPQKLELCSSSLQLELCTQTRIISKCRQMQRKINVTWFGSKHPCKLLRSWCTALNGSSGRRCGRQLQKGGCGLQNQ